MLSLKFGITDKASEAWGKTSGVRSGTCRAISSQMRPSLWKRRLVSAVRWLLLVDAGVSALAALLTVFPWPVWTAAMGNEAWPVGMVVPEIALWLVPLPIFFAAAALWLGRRGGRRWLTQLTVVLCAAAVVLFCKPAVQAWRLGRTLDTTLDAAFGVPPVPPPCPPFSLAAAALPRNPAAVAIETMQYADGLALDFYRPPAADRSPRPCVVVIHGGSWVHGNRVDDGTKRWLNDWLGGLGYAVASIDYRLSPQFKWPAQRDDLLAAIRFLRDRATDLRIDADRLVLVGRSAGAQMAIATAYAEMVPGVRGIVDIYGPTDFDLTWDAATRPRSLDHRYNLEIFLGGTPQTARAAYQTASGAKLVTPRAPPTLILQGVLDINVFPEQAKLLDRSLAAAGVPHALVSLPWAGHAFDFVNFNTPGAQIGRYAIMRFLASVTR
ncbi:MAG TPA: alpha/beta hydrolase [Tepidisphaeraceae bacterium]